MGFLFDTWGTSWSPAGADTWGGSWGSGVAPPTETRSGADGYPRRGRTTRNLLQEQDDVMRAMRALLPWL